MIGNQGQALDEEPTADSNMRTKTDTTRAERSNAEADQNSYSTAFVDSRPGAACPLTSMAELKIVI